LTSIAALIAAVASTVGIAYQIWPEHHFRATVSVSEKPKLNVDRAVYLREVHADPPYRRAGGKGARFLLRALVEGVDRSKLKVVSYIYTSATDQPVLSWEDKDADIFSRGTAISHQFVARGFRFPRRPASTTRGSSCTRATRSSPTPTAGRSA